MWAVEKIGERTCLVGEDTCYEILALRDSLQLLNTPNVTDASSVSGGLTMEEHTKLFQLKQFIDKFTIVDVSTNLPMAPIIKLLENGKPPENILPGATKSEEEDLVLKIASLVVAGKPFSELMDAEIARKKIEDRRQKFNENSLESTKPEPAPFKTWDMVLKKRTKTYSNDDDDDDSKNDSENDSENNSESENDFFEIPKEDLPADDFNKDEMQQSSTEKPEETETRNEFDGTGTQKSKMPSLLEQSEQRQHSTRLQKTQKGKSVSKFASSFGVNSMEDMPTGVPVININTAAPSDMEINADPLIHDAEYLYQQNVARMMLNQIEQNGGHESDPNAEYNQGHIVNIEDMNEKNATVFLPNNLEVDEQGKIVRRLDNNLIGLSAVEAAEAQKRKSENDFSLATRRTITSVSSGDAEKELARRYYQEQLLQESMDQHEKEFIRVYLTTEKCPTPRPEVVKKILEFVRANSQQKEDAQGKYIVRPTMPSITEFFAAVGHIETPEESARRLADEMKSFGMSSETIKSVLDTAKAQPSSLVNSNSIEPVAEYPKSVNEILHLARPFQTKKNVDEKKDAQPLSNEKVEKVSFTEKVSASSPNVGLDAKSSNMAVNGINTNNVHHATPVDHVSFVLQLQTSTNRQLSLLGQYLSEVSNSQHLMTEELIKSRRA